MQDGDGDLDLAMVNDYGPLLLYRNDTVRQGNWVQLRLKGTTSNRPASGAIVIIDAGGQPDLQSHRRITPHQRQPA